jgi:hypothetical protein
VDENEALVDYASFENCFDVEELEAPTAGELIGGSSTTPIFSTTLDEPTTSVAVETTTPSTRRLSPLRMHKIHESDTNHARSQSTKSLDVLPKAVPIPSLFRRRKEPVPLPPRAMIPPTLGVLPGLLRVDSELARRRRIH